MGKINNNKNWMIVTQKDGFKQLIFMSDVLPYRFAFDDKIKKITINTYATQIGQYAFYGCPELEEIIVNVKTLDISKYAFAYCPKLKNVTFNYERKFDKFLSVNEMAFGGCGIIEFHFSDETTYINATQIKRNETYSDLHIQAVTKMLQKMANTDYDATFSIDLQGGEFTKASNVIDIRPLADGKFYLTDGGCLFGVLGQNPNLGIGWVRDYIEVKLRNKKFFFKEGEVVSLCKDIDEAADVLIEICNTIRMLGGLSYYLENADNTTEIAEEEIDEALRAQIKKSEDLTKEQVEDILLNMVGKNPDGIPDLRECMKISYMHAKIKKMTEEEFKRYRSNKPSAECEPVIRAKVNKLMRLLEDYPFDYKREDNVFENICLDLIEDIVGLAPDQNRSEAIEIAQTVLEIFRDKNADKNELKVLERVLHEFEIASDDEYNNLRRQIFEG